MMEGLGGGSLRDEGCSDEARGPSESERIAGDPAEVARRLEAKVVREAAAVACSAGSLSIHRDLPNLLAALRLARLLASGMEAAKPSRRETGSTEGDSPVAKPDAQTPGDTPHDHR
jgi:hypothetical protein